MAIVNLIQILADGMVYDGEPMAGGNAQIYETGTTNLVTVYSDRNQGGTLTNPVTLDSQGAVNAFIDDIVDINIRDSDDTVRYAITELDATTPTEATSEFISSSLDIYVDASQSDDTGDGLTSGTAKKFLQSGLELAQKLPTDGATVVIHIEAGSYGSTSDRNWEIRGLYSLNAGGNQSSILAKGIQLVAENGTVTLDGVDHTGVSAVFAITNSNVLLTGNFNIRNTGATVMHGLLIQANSVVGHTSGTLNIDGMTDLGISVSTGSSCGFLNIVCSNNADNGISISDNASVTIDGDLTCNSNTKDGVLVLNGHLNLRNSTASSVNTITCSNNSFSGISVFGSGVMACLLDVNAEMLLDLDTNTLNGISANNGGIIHNVFEGAHKFAIDADGNNTNLYCANGSSITFGLIESITTGIVIELTNSVAENLLCEAGGSIHFTCAYSGVTIDSVLRESKVTGGGVTNITCRYSGAVSLRGMGEITGNASSVDNISCIYSSSLELSGLDASNRIDMNDATKTGIEVDCDDCSSIHINYAELTYHDVSGYLFNASGASAIRANGCLLNNGTTTNRIDVSINGIFRDLANNTDNGSGVDSTATGGVVV